MSPVSKGACNQYRKPNLIASILVFFILLVALNACDEREVPSLKVTVGQPVPALLVENLSNQPASIKAVRDKLLMINVWATWCAPCRHELPSLQRLAESLGDDKLVLVGLSVDDDEHLVREYLIDKKINFTSFIDKDMSEVTKLLGVRLYPSTFFVNPDGRLVKVIEGWQEWDTPEMVDSIRTLLPAN